MKKLALKIILILFVLTLSGIGLLTLTYSKILPKALSDKKVINKIENIVKKYADIDVSVINPYLKTDDFPYIEFKADKISAEKDNKKLLEINRLDSLISLKEILNKTIIINRLGVDTFYADINPILETLPKQQNTKPVKSDWIVDFYDSILYLNNSQILYSLDNGTNINLKAYDLSIDNTQKTERFVHFKFEANIQKNGKQPVYLAFKDDNKIVIKNKHIYVNECPLTLNRSQIFFDASAGVDNQFEISIFAKRFFIPDIIKLLQTDIVENNINDVLAIIKDINGDIDFRINLTNNDLNGILNLNRLSGKVFYLSNIPFNITSGKITLKKNDLFLSDFKGYYDNKRYNTFDFEGYVKDYLKTLDTHIDVHALLTNDFFEKYLSKTAMVPLTLEGKSQSKIIINSKNNNFDITLMGKIAKGDDILVAGSSLSPKNYDRALKADIHLQGDNLNIESIKYYIAKELTRESKGIKPILTLNGNINVTTGKIKDLGFDIPNPLPSEFLNVLISQRVFKGGKFSGNMKMTNNGNYPVLDGRLTAENIRIPTQRLMLKQGEIITKNNEIDINANGRYRRSQYTFDGAIVNAIKFPIIIKHTNLTIDNINVAKIMQAFTSPVQAASYDSTEEDEEIDDNATQTFDISNVIIEKAQVKINHGSYKEIEFKDVEANMSLDKNSLFKLQSNLFEIAQGYTNARVECDLKNQKYYIRLGIKEVDSDLMSTAILNLKREISGKASGLIELNTDESLKLNGIIKFQVKNGSIQKIGLVEYVLKFASLFRNPLAMISPGMFADLVNIPEGNFDKIDGDMKIKNNVIELMRIKSYSPQLSAYIIGRYDLETSDAILRIYTKFSNRRKGVGGILRNISLNALANRIPLNSRNDANYYSAELEQLPDIDADEKDCQVFLTKVDGDVEHNNFISSLKKIK